MMDEKNIIFVGSGIKFYAHLTVEAIAHIKNADIVLYLVNEPAMMQWLNENSKQACSLEDIYNTFTDRIDSYNAIADHILSTCDRASSICVVIYGHPLILCMPTKIALTNCPENIKIKVLPGISSDSCLYADVGIDPIINGMQSYEATEFLLYKKIIDPSAHLILWQIGVIGNIENIFMHNNKKGITLLKKKLLQYYPNSHEIILYEATQYPHIDSIISKVLLQDLDKENISQLMTLYIPPLSQNKVDEIYINLLKEE